MEIKKPNFLLVGASKSGTSSIHKYLQQHPDIFLPNTKEPLFFIRHEIIDNLSSEDKALKNENIINKLPKTFEEYLLLFNEAEQEKIIGECSATYLYYNKYSIPNIKYFIGNNIKILIILRNPVEKAFSQFKHLKRLGGVKGTFEEELKLEKYRIKNNYSGLYHLTNQGFYYKQVKAFFENFNQVKIILTEDLENDTSNTLKEIYNFLDVDEKDNFKITEKYNVSKFIPKNYNLHRLLNTKAISFFRKKTEKVFPKHFMNKIKLYYKNRNNEDLVLKKETEQYLKSLFEEDIIKLEKLINRDLSSWYQ